MSFDTEVFNVDEVLDSYTGHFLFSNAHVIKVFDENLDPQMHEWWNFLARSLNFSYPGHQMLVLVNRSTAAKLLRGPCFKLFDPNPNPSKLLTDGFIGEGFSRKFYYVPSQTNCTIVSWKDSEQLN